MRGVPHFDYPPWASYDGQFYAQRALDPLCRDPFTDRAMDLAPFRARRILFSWTAYALGLGRPVWILEAYALQNVVCWLLLAWLLAHWIPPVTARGLALWSACLLSHGVLWSVRFALLDVPSLVLIACAVRAVEAGRPLLSAAIVGVAGLGRETNLLAGAAQPIPRGRRPSTGSGRMVSLSNHRGWIRLGLAILLMAIPLLLWGDYLRSIYRSTIFAGTDTLAAPGTAIAARWMQALERVRTGRTLLSRVASLRLVVVDRGAGCLCARPMGVPRRPGGGWRSRMSG